MKGFGWIFLKELEASASLKDLEACEIEQHGLKAQVTTYTLKVDACAKSGDMFRAEKWMGHMEAAEVEPNVVSLRAMIDACAKAGSHQGRCVACENVRVCVHAYLCVCVCARMRVRVRACGGV